MHLIPKCIVAQIQISTNSAARAIQVKCTSIYQDGHHPSKMPPFSCSVGKEEHAGLNVVSFSSS